MKRKKILLVIPELIMGGAQRSLAKLSVKLAEHHQVWIVIFNRKDPVAYDYGGELLSLDVFSGDNVFQKITAFRKRSVRLKQIKKDLGIDVSISFLEGADYINVLSRGREKVILSVRGSKHHDENMVGNFFWLRHRVFIPWLYRKADMIVTVNHGIRSELQHYGISADRCVTIGNFYDFKQIEQASDEPKPGSLLKLYSDPIVVTTGRLAREKGLPELMEIFSELKKKFSRLRFVIVGNGPLRDELNILAGKLGLTITDDPEFTDLPDIYLTGNQSNVFKYLKGAAIYLMNSTSEGFPNGLAEAMICKVPVVSSDCPYGPREILAPEFVFTNPVQEAYISSYGILLPIARSSEDQKIWINTLAGVLEKPVFLSQLAEKARERVNIFEQETTISQWLGILK